MRSITISLQLVDHSVKYLMGVLEDIPIKARDLYVSVDFRVLKMKEDTCTLIIIGRPFLTTSRCIDVKMVNCPSMWEMIM